MSAQSYPVEVTHRNGTRADARLVIGHETPTLGHRVHLTLHVMNRKIHAHESDYFTALTLIRQEIEPLGLQLNCWGASRNVAMSAACEEKTLGRIGCRFTLGRPVLPTDYVNIFETGPGVAPSSVEDQRAYHRKWLESLGWQFDHNGLLTGKTLRYNPYNPPMWIQLQLRARDMLASYRRKRAHPVAG